MKASIIQIGNSQGLRIPKPILKQCGFDSEVELEVQGRKLIIKPHTSVRKNWEKSFETMVENGDDQLLEFGPNQWDEEEWEWK
jgi:antitoxin MazE